MQDTLKHIDQHGYAPPTHGLPSWQGKKRPYANDGRDDTKTLPSKDSTGRDIRYHEFDVHPFRGESSRGTERLVTGTDGSAWYTHTHYKTFQRVR
ncbi:ribonuclease domain-containing protein [Streptomyces zhihengii]